MSLFKPARNTMAYAKVGLLGFAGSGKTRTAWEIARGLHATIKSKKPVAFMDTETGSDFILPLANQAKIELIISKSRAFENLVDGIKEAENLTDILIIDSVSHYWVDLVESYKKKKEVNRLAFQDWGILKPKWGEFSMWYVNSRVHVIVCGRAGFEYDYFEGDDGKMELYKTGTKMKAEGEFGFEPSLLIEMERIKNPQGTDEYRKAKGKQEKEKAARSIRDDRVWVRRAWVLKDRADVLDGKCFDNPTFADFSPHWKHLNIGGEHMPLEAGDSTALFDSGGKPEWKKEKEQITILLEEVQALLVLHIPGQDVKSKQDKIKAVEFAFGVRSWSAVEAMSLPEIKEGLVKLRTKYEPDSSQVPPVWRDTTQEKDAFPAGTSDDETFALLIPKPISDKMDGLNWTDKHRREFLEKYEMRHPDKMTASQIAAVLRELDKPQEQQKQG